MYREKFEYKSSNWKIGKYRREVHGIWGFRYAIPREILVAMHNGSNYDFYWIIKKLVGNFQSSDFNCLRENNKRHIRFSISMDKKLKKTKQNKNK